MAKKSSKREFQWTDDEAELLLQSTHLYKAKKSMENVDWESVKSKYEDILEIMREELPETKEEAKELTKEYTHSKEEVTKSILTTKLKNIRLRYRKAVDSG